METLHIYAQAQWHDEAWIAGNEEGLRLLRDAIDKALIDRKAESDHVFTTDGEGYRVHVLSLTEIELDSLVMPYTDESIRVDGVWPGTIIKTPALRGATNLNPNNNDAESGASLSNVGLGLDAEAVQCYLYALLDEAKSRGGMFPQTSDDQDSDSEAIHRICGMVKWYGEQGYPRSGEVSKLRALRALNRGPTEKIEAPTLAGPY